MTESAEGRVRSLTPELTKVVTQTLEAYLSGAAGPNGPPVTQVQAEHDDQRVTIIEEILKPLLAGYFNGSVPLVSFKRQVDGINKQNELWGFRGTKGQMFFNMLLNAAKGEDECDAELKHALAVPKDENAAAAQLRRFYEYTVRVGEEFIHAGGNRRSRPKPGSVPFFVSYFWQVQQRDLWPVYYTNSVQVITALNLWEETGEVGNDYLSYKRLHDALVELFSKTAGRAFSLYDVEHVFWFKGGKPIKGYERDSEVKTGTRHEIDRPKTEVDLSDSYLPPVVAIIPALASNDPTLRNAASQAGTTIDRVLEKSCNAALTILGYETKL